MVLKSPLMSADHLSRRTFLGWAMAGLMTSTVVTALAPILIYIWPNKGNRKRTAIQVALTTPLAKMPDQFAQRIDSPTSPNFAFVMKDGGGDNAPGKLSFGGWVTRTGDQTEVYAINCPHLGCSYNFNPQARTFDCPCHGSRFRLDGSVLHGPATAPLAHLSWTRVADDEIALDGLPLE